MASSFFCVAVLFVFTSRSLLSLGSPISDTDDPEVCRTQMCQESARFLLDAMDVSVDPCEDFYRYSCGGWIDKRAAPKDLKIISVMNELQDEVYSMVAEILRNAHNENHAKAVLDAATLFQGCMDEGARERQGLDPLRNVLNSLGGWPMIDPQWSNTSYQWYKQIATMKRTLGVEVIISVSVDDQHMEYLRYVLNVDEPEHHGLEDTYLKNETSERKQEVIAAYKNYIISAGKILNPSMDETSLANDADEIIEFMEALAAKPEPLPRNHRKRHPWYEELMNFIEFLIAKTHVGTKPPDIRICTVSEVQRITQNEYFEWRDFLNDVLQDLPQVEDGTKISSYSMDYLKHAIRVVQNTDSRTVANYIGWILLQNIGHHTTKDFRDIADHFKTILEEKEADNLETACVKETANVLGFAVGRLYADKYVSEDEMREVEQLAEDIRTAFEVNFNHNDWMDPATKQKALEKLRNMVNFIGYPSWIKIDSELNEYYSSVSDVKQDEYFESFVTVKTATEKINLGKWNQPSHRTTEWMSVIGIIEVNAFYFLSRNVMYFPAAIFNLPIYKQGTVPALNYAGIGSFIAHEITHGFDNGGHRFDKEGKDVNWWTEDTKKKFDEKAECLRKQYEEILEPMTNTSLQAGQTLQDDIADNGAARYAYMAYKMQVLQAEENQVIKRNTRLPGLSATPEQLYFVGYGTMECARYTERSMKWTIKNDGHSPAEYRIRIPLRNSRAFSEAFNCPVGSPMNPEMKCQLW